MYDFTQEELIQYMYHETSPEKTAAIEVALNADFRLREALYVLYASHEELEGIKLLAPRQQAIDKIMQYAEKSVNQIHA